MLIVNYWNCILWESLSPRHTRTHVACVHMTAGSSSTIFEKHHLHSSFKPWERYREGSEDAACSSRWPLWPRRSPCGCPNDACQVWVGGATPKDPPAVGPVLENRASVSQHFLGLKISIGSCRDKCNWLIWLVTVWHFSRFGFRPFSQFQNHFHLLSCNRCNLLSFNWMQSC